MARRPLVGISTWGKRKWVAQGMTLLHQAAPIASLLLVLHVPVGGCARACGKTASHSGDDVARLGRQGAGALGDDVVRARPRWPVALPKLNHAVSSAELSLATEVTMLPKVTGAPATDAFVATAKGTRLVGTRKFGSSYAKTYDQLAITASEHTQIVDALGAALDALDVIAVMMDAPEYEAVYRAQVEALDDGLRQALGEARLREFYRWHGDAKLLLYRIRTDGSVQRAHAPELAPD